MARPNELEQLRKLLEALPRIGEGFVPYDRMAQMMGCSVADARGVVEELRESDLDEVGLDYRVFEPASARRLRDLLEADPSLAQRLRASQPDAVEAIGRMCECGGIYLEGGFGILSSQPRLTREESQALLSALDFAGVPAHSAVVRKLQSNVMPSTVDEGDVQGYLAQGVDYEALRKLSLLCQQGRMAKVWYLSIDDAGVVDPDELEPRLIAPLLLYTGSTGQVYLDAWSYAAEEVRTFRLDRMLHVEEQARHANAEVLGMAKGSRSLVASDAACALLELDAGEALDEREWIGMRVVGQADGGGQLVQVPINEDATWVARHVAARFGRVRVVEPQWLAHEVAACAQQAREALAELRSSLEGKVG